MSFSALRAPVRTETVRARFHVNHPTSRPSPRTGDLALLVAAVAPAPLHLVGGASTVDHRS